MNDSTKEILKQIISGKRDYLKHVADNVICLEKELSSERAKLSCLISEIAELEEDLNK